MSVGNDTMDVMCNHEKVMCVLGDGSSLDCNSFCPLCEGEGEYCPTCHEHEWGVEKGISFCLQCSEFEDVLKGSYE
jgi:hypothetical protein